MYCNCFGPCCFVGNTLDCICEDCDCGSYVDKVTSITAEEAKVMTEAMQAPDRPTRTLPPRPEHTCQDCGVEVFRNGTRGRFPSRCPECKEK